MINTIARSRNDDTSFASANWDVALIQPVSLAPWSHHLRQQHNANDRHQTERTGKPEKEHGVRTHKRCEDIGGNDNGAKQLQCRSHPPVAIGVSLGDFS